MLAVLVVEILVEVLEAKEVVLSEGCPVAVLIVLVVLKIVVLFMVEDDVLEELVLLVVVVGAV